MTDATPDPTPSRAPDHPHARRFHVKLYIHMTATDQQTGERFSCPSFADAADGMSRAGVTAIRAVLLRALGELHELGVTADGLHEATVKGEDKSPLPPGNK